MFNICIKKNWTPPEWNEEITVPLHKGGNSFEPNAYRGIALSSTIGKIFARIINEFTETAVREKEILPERKRTYQNAKIRFGRQKMLVSLVYTIFY